MKREIRDGFNFIEFKDFAQYLLKNHLDDLSRENLKLTLSYKLPLLALFSHLTEEALFNLTRQSTQQFLEEVLNNQALPAAMSAIDKWKAGELPGIPAEKVQVSDLILSYSIRKQLYMKFLPFYTQDCTAFIAIINELEVFHIYLEQYAFDAYISIQQKELRKSNSSLQEFQEELQASNEELQQSEEELAATNEELVEQLRQVENMQAELKKNELELKISLDHYLTILQDFPALIWRSDATGSCDYFNNTWLNFTGTTLKEACGNGWEKSVHPQDLEKCISRYSKNFVTHTPFSMEYQLRRHDGEYRWILDFGKPLFDLNKNFIGFLGACYDITDQKESQQQLMEINKILKLNNDELVMAEGLLKNLNTKLEENVRERTMELESSAKILTAQNERLKKMNEYMDNFVFAAAHDLKSPVVNLKLLVNNINRPELAAERDNLLGSLTDVVNRLDKTLNGLVQIIEVQSDEANAAKRLDIREAIEMAKLEYAHEIQECQAQFDIQLEAESTEIFYFEPFLLSIVKNLLSNSLKYCCKDRPLVIHIKAYKSEGYSLLSFDDNGNGIDLEKHRKNLFKAFNRFSKNSEGTGIGLHLIKSMVEKNGGKVMLESVLGEGTSVVVFFKEYAQQESNFSKI